MKNITTSLILLLILSGCKEEHYYGEGDYIYNISCVNFEDSISYANKRIFATSEEDAREKIFNLPGMDKFKSSECSLNFKGVE